MSNLILIISQKKIEDYKSHEHFSTYFNYKATYELIDGVLYNAFSPFFLIFDMNIKITSKPTTYSKKS